MGRSPARISGFLFIHLHQETEQSQTRYLIISFVNFFRNFPEDRNNDHRDITFPHGDNPGDGDDEEDDVSSDSADEDENEVTQKKLTYAKKGGLISVVSIKHKVPFGIRKSDVRDKMILLFDFRGAQIKMPTGQKMKQHYSKID